MVKVENLKAIEGGKAVEIDYLGCLVWSSVRDILDIPTEDLRKALEDEGLDKFMPRPINTGHAFRRVTKSLEKMKIPCGEGRYINLLVRNVKAEAGEVVRQLVRETVDGENIRLDYRPVLQMEIKEEAMAIKALVADLEPEEEEIQKNLSLMLDRAIHFYDGVHIRYMLFNILHDCHPVSVRPSGGVTFVPQRYAETIDSVKKLCKKFDGVKMWSIPVIDAEEHRELVGESLEEQVIGGSNNLIEEMKKIMEDPTRNVTMKLIQGFADRVKGLKEIVTEYEEMLEIQATKARENLELARLQAVKFMEAVTEREAE